MNLFERATGLATRHLSAERLNWARNSYLSLRRRLYPAMQRWYGTFDASGLRAELEQRVGNDFEILMVHSSVNHMQPMYTEGPLELLRMLTEFCGPDRTLAMPAFYFGDPAIGGARATFEQNPSFDLRRTPSQMGLLTELFRRSKGVYQSRHPVLRVSALGPLAESMTSGHEQADTPCGRNTPFDFMATHDTLILGIGKPFEVLTQVHHAEDLLGDAFPVPRTPAPPLAMSLIDGEQKIPFSLAGGGLEAERDMGRLRNIMPRGSLAEWRFHHVPLFSTRARDVTDSLITAARRGVTLYNKP